MYRWLDLCGELCCYNRYRFRPYYMDSRPLYTHKEVEEKSCYG